MATTDLQVSFDICQCECSEIDFSETTGLVNPANTGGWTSPNPTTSDATSAVFSLQFPDTSTLLPAGTPIEVDLYDTFPRTTGDLYKMNTEDFEMSEDSKFIDGIYYGQYTVAGVFNSIPFTSTDGNYFLFTCQVECCLNKAFIKANADCGCESKEIDKIMLGLTMLEVAKDATKCGNIEDAASLLKQAQEVCAATGCNC